MNHCRKCESDYEKPGTCNCFASRPATTAPVVKPTDRSFEDLASKLREAQERRQKRCTCPRQFVPMTPPVAVPVTWTSRPCPEHPVRVTFDA